MALAFYDDTPVLFSTALRTFHDGHLGGSSETLVYIRNGDASKYYTNIVVSYEAPDPGDIGEFGDTGWGVKLAYGQRRPTEAEWDQVTPGESISIVDIGAFGAADTSTYHPVWIRVFCPGDSPAQLRAAQLVRVSYNEQSA